jgi:hypothetical protein
MIKFYKPTILGLQLLIVTLVLSVFLNSCDKFEGDQTVPSYIKIDSISVYTDFNTQGTASHNIVDAWIYVDDNLIGAYQLPCIVPVLKEGYCKIVVKAGIELNGIAALRTPYPFYESIVIEDQVLVRDSILDFGSELKTTYGSTTIFAWMENFQASLSIESASDSDTSIVQITDADLVFHDPGIVHNNVSGMVSINSIDSFYEGITKDAFEIPTSNTSVILEMNFKIENIITVGLFATTTTSITQDGILNLNKTSTWKKIYVNLTPAVIRNSSAYEFNVFVGTELELNLSEAKIYLDNIKLVHR